MEFRRVLFQSHHPIISKLWRMFLEVATDDRHKKARQTFRRRACLNSGTFGLHSSANEVSHLKSDNGAVVRHIERSLARSEDRRVGKEGVRTCRSRWSTYH